MTAAKKKKKRKRNPTVLVLGNPPVKGELFGDRVTLLEYHHIEDEGNVVRWHPFEPGVLMYALEDGNILLVNTERPLWGQH